tara:strand:+ start:2685 stop:3047 length:363 start_codon:yes stop_codon:yes gene_type:complete
VATNNEILEQIDELRKKMPNGELTLLAKSVDDLQEGQHELKEDIRDLKKQLLDPDNGVVVRVNKNSSVRRLWESRNDEVEGTISNVKSLLGWQDGVNKALWILFAVTISLFVKLAFFNGQ